jgi:hypothetical protein
MDDDVDLPPDDAPELPVEPIDWAYRPPSQEALVEHYKDAVTADQVTW